ncbi:hypothetical protein B0O99DRAFT_597709 [Bisporella sp. PMI_857]|nr:hypothetical protein B0O99DRAFT_597709 [Bisporella sp. PMI_857]
MSIPQFRLLAEPRTVGSDGTVYPPIVIEVSSADPYFTNDEKYANYSATAQLFKDGKLASFDRNSTYTASMRALPSDERYTSQRGLQVVAYLYIGHLKVSGAETCSITVQIDQTSHSDGFATTNTGHVQTATFLVNGPSQSDVVLIPQITISETFLQFFSKADNVAKQEIFGQNKFLGLMNSADASQGQEKIIVEFSSPNIAKPFYARILLAVSCRTYITVGYQKYGDDTELEADLTNHFFDVCIKINKDKEVEEEEIKCIHRNKARLWLNYQSRGLAIESWERFIPWPNAQVEEFMNPVRRDGCRTQLQSESISIPSFRSCTDMDTRTATSSIVQSKIDHLEAHFSKLACDSNATTLFIARLNAEILGTKATALRLYLMMILNRNIRLWMVWDSNAWAPPGI